MTWNTVVERFIDTESLYTRGAGGTNLPRCPVGGGNGECGFHGGVLNKEEHEA
jgi:hypothetical protein